LLLQSEVEREWALGCAARPRESEEFSADMAESLSSSSSPAKASTSLPITGSERDLAFFNEDRAQGSTHHTTQGAGNDSRSNSRAAEQQQFVTSTNGDPRIEAISTCALPAAEYFSNSYFETLMRTSSTAALAASGGTRQEGRETTLPNWTDRSPELVATLTMGDVATPRRTIGAAAESRATPDRTLDNRPTSSRESSPDPVLQVQRTEVTRGLAMVVERLTAAQALAEVFHESHPGNGLFFVAGRAATLGSDPLEAVKIVIASRPELPHSQLTSTALTRAAQSNTTFEEAWLYTVEEFTKQSEIRRRANTIDTEVSWSGVTDGGMTPRRTGGIQSQPQSEKRRTLSSGTAPCSITPETDAAKIAWQQRESIPGELFPDTMRATRKEEARAKALTREPTKLLTQPSSTGGALVTLGNTCGLSADLVHFCEQQTWDVASLMEVPQWFNKAPPDFVDQTLIIREGTHTYTELATRVIRKAKQMILWQHSGTGFVETCSVAALVALFKEESPETALTGTTKARRTLVYIRTRAPIRGLLAEGRLQQIIIRGESAQDAARYILVILIAACREAALTAVVDRCRTFVTDGRGDEGIEKVLDLIDTEFLQATARETRAAFEQAVWVVGTRPKEALLHLGRLGNELSLSEPAVYARWKEAIKAARDEEGLPARTGDQEYVNRVVSRFAGSQYIFTTTRQLEADIDEDNRFKEPLRAREEATQAIKRERRAYAAEERSGSENFSPTSPTTGSSPTSEDIVNRLSDAMVKIMNNANSAKAVTVTAPPAGEDMVSRLSEAMEKIMNNANSAKAVAVAAPSAGEDTVGRLTGALEKIFANAAFGARPNAERFSFPEGPLKVDAILASGEIIKLKGVNAQPLWNVRREDGKYGKDCTLCRALGQEYVDEREYNAFLKEFGAPKNRPPQLKTTAIVHFQPWCRELRMAVGRAVSAKPSLAWMLEKDPDFESKRKAAHDNVKDH